MDIPFPGNPIKAEVATTTPDGDTLVKVAGDRDESRPVKNFLLSDNSFIDVVQKFYNIGPTNFSQDETVEVRPFSTKYAMLLSDSVDDPNYVTRFKATSGFFQGEIIEKDRDSGEGILLDGKDDTRYAVGPITQDAVGREVLAYNLADSPMEHENIPAKGFAIALDRDVWGKDSFGRSYYGWIRKRGGTKNSRASPPSSILLDLIQPCVGDVYTVEPEDDGDGDLVVETIEHKNNISIGRCSLNPGERVRVRMFDQGRDYAVCCEQSVYIEDIRSRLNNQITQEEIEFFYEIYDAFGNSITSQPESDTTGEQERADSAAESTEKSESEPVITEPASDNELTDLRRKAERAATENPARDTSASPSSAYQRSESIKQYAKARAGGNCEYCEEQAPFETPEGEPYLEVHHVDELGEEGEDSPEKVVALCPSCHKEIHYGHRGDQINNELRQKLADGLAEVGTQ
jgi:5-methylcytosine-specific restriction endonuclease McrA